MNLMHNFFMVSLCLDFKTIWSFDLNYILNSSFTLEVFRMLIWDFEIPSQYCYKWNDQMNDNILFPLLKHL